MRWFQQWPRNTKRMKIYLTVMLTYNPARALELVGYQCTITPASQSLPLKSWLQYDGQFRTLAASNPCVRWDQRHTELWYEAMATAQWDTRRWPCLYCGAKNHFPENCLRSPFCDSSKHTKPKAGIHMVNEMATGLCVDCCEVCCAASTKKVFSNKIAKSIYSPLSICCCRWAGTGTGSCWTTCCWVVG